MKRLTILAVLAAGLFAQTFGDVLCLSTDKDGNMGTVVCPLSPEARIVVLEGKVAELQAIVKEMGTRLNALEGKAAYPGFVGVPQ